MLIIDDNKLRLARMQETLLRVSNENREENLEIYKKTVIEIDTQAFADIVEQIGHINEHNHTLEEELKFLEEIKKTYDQLLELQISFRNVCNDLELSDLSQLNIEYIENRINVINGYLTNIKNIEANKIKLQELSEQLIVEEKKNKYLNDKMLELDESLRQQFIIAEGRTIVGGKSVPTSVVQEYDKIGINFIKFLEDSSGLSILLETTKNKSVEMEEKLRTAEICFNSSPNQVSKQVYDEIMIESLKVKYKLTMLKILELLALNCTSYDMFKEKRENLIDLIKYRLSCLTKLGGVVGEY